MATSVEPEIAYVRPCLYCKRTIPMRLTKTGRAHGDCDGELQDDGAHCGTRFTLSKKIAMSELERARSNPKPEPEPDDKRRPDPEPAPERDERDDFGLKW